ncbi:MAG: hypothetical protein ACREQ8_11625, partial [Woeseiaceae bacterium]
TQGGMPRECIRERLFVCRLRRLRGFTTVWSMHPRYPPTSHFTRLKKTIHRSYRAVIDRRLRKSLSSPGLLLGTLFSAFSLTPSLLPRSALMQGLVVWIAVTEPYGWTQEDTRRLKALFAKSQ